MKKRFVGIYANYDASEQTLCAEYLAGYISTCYRYVRWFVPNSPKQSEKSRGFSHQWDSQVVSCQGNSTQMRRKAKHCDTFFFFEPNDELLSHLPEEAVTAFVFNPRIWNAQTVDFAKRCTYSLIPEGCCMNRTSDFAGLRKPMSWPYDPSLQFITRQGVDYSSNPRLFFPAFGLEKEDRAFVEQVAEIVKMCQPCVQSVVGYYDATVEPKPGIDSRTYDWRLLKYLQNSEWVIDLNPRPLYCFFAACAGGYGAQWMAFNLAPNSAPLNAARRHLIQEPVKDNVPRSEIRVIPDVESTVTQIVQRLRTPFSGSLEANRCVGAWDNRRAEFYRVTNIVLGIRTKH